MQRMHLIESKAFTVVIGESKNTVIHQIMKNADDTCPPPRFLSLISFHRYSCFHYLALYFPRGSLILNWNCSYLSPLKPHNTIKFVPIILWFYNNLTFLLYQAQGRFVIGLRSRFLSEGRVRQNTIRKRK